MLTTFLRYGATVYINHRVAALLDKLRIEFTRLRPRHSNDNGLAETKNGAVVRKIFGYEHIPQRHAARFNTFCRESPVPVCHQQARSEETGAHPARVPPQGRDDAPGQAGQPGALRCAGEERQRLEQLCRYITRPALANERVQCNSAGQVVLKLKTPWHDGTTHMWWAEIRTEIRDRLIDAAGVSHVLGQLRWGWRTHFSRLIRAIAEPD